MMIRPDFVGPALDDEEVLARCPEFLVRILRLLNGFVEFGGGFHMRGACREPAWHSLRNAWEGEDAFQTLYPEIKATDLPFGEDCLGDQFLLRDDVVWKLWAETGELESLKLPLVEWMAGVQAWPAQELSMEPLLQFQDEGGKLEPGHLLSAMPPFCVRESEKGVSLRAVPSLDRRRFLADLARQVRDLPDGSTITFGEADDE
jgi:hypothetical protein